MLTHFFMVSPTILIYFMSFYEYANILNFHFRNLLRITQPSINISYIHWIKSSRIFLGKRCFPKEAPLFLKQVNPFWAHPPGSLVKTLQMGSSGSLGSLCSIFLAMLSAHLTQTLKRIGGKRRERWGGRNSGKERNMGTRPVWLRS